MTFLLSGLIAALISVIFNLGTPAETPSINVGSDLRVLTVPQGGTGWANIQANTLLTGNGTNRLATTSIGSGLTLSNGVLSAAGAQANALSTSSPWTVGNLAYVTSDSAVTSVATGTLSCTSPLSCTSRAVIGGASAVSISNAAADGSTKGAASFTTADFDATSGNISLDYTNGQAASGAAKGFLTSADWTTFNNKESALTFSWPLIRTTNTISWSGLSTSTVPSANQIAYWSSGSALAGNAALTFDGTRLNVTYASTTALSSSGSIVGTREAYTGAISPLRSFVLTTGTTTTWTATTSAAYVPFVVAPFAGALRDVSCIASSTAAFLGVTPFINSTPTTPSYFVASNTPGTVGFSSNNTFVKGDILGMNVGTSTTDAAAKRISCTFRATETP